jgi:hypothetical protein
MSAGRMGKITGVNVVVATTIWLQTMAHLPVGGTLNLQD